MEFSGRVWRLGDNIDTDVIIPARWLNTTDPQELASHCLEDIQPEFNHAVQAGDIIVAGRNFGCGSSREHAPIAIKASGVACVVATSFARIFYRNAINIGLPILECPGGTGSTETSHQLLVNVENGRVKNLTTGEVYQANPFPPFMRELIRAGGLLPYVAAQIGRQQQP
ncbi:MAG: 3-isopropylmalate dehydratase small subunit [Clostridia bacterium]|nr:MAG: 3-isopropylmalate dehydratase small subunit [Clostridia bacterium]